MKLDKELYTKHAKRLQAILNEKSTFAQYIARPDFSKVIEVSLNTLAVIEKKMTTVELPAKLSAKTLAKEFNKLGKNTFKLDENFKYGDEGDLIDNINYLSTYCKNIYKVNIDELVDGKQVTAANPTIDLKGKPEVEDMAEAMGAAGMGFGGFGPMGAYENPFVMGKAYAKFKEETAKGNIYTYKSKPRVVILAKWISVVTISIAIISLIVMAVFAFMSASLAIKGYKADGSIGEGTMGFNATGSGIMYLLVGLFGAYPMYLLIKGLTSKNDNLKYYFNWPWVLIFILMLIIFVMPDMRQTWITWFISILDSATASSKMAHNAWKIMYIVTLACGGLCLPSMIIGAINNPKQDQALIEKTLKQYADEVIASSGFGPTPSNTGADVQKPVEVKKTEKKEDKKETDTPSKSKK